MRPRGRERVYLYDPREIDVLRVLVGKPGIRDLKVFVIAQRVATLKRLTRLTSITPMTRSNSRHRDVSHPCQDDADRTGIDAWSRIMSATYLMLLIP